MAKVCGFASWGLQGLGVSWGRSHQLPCGDWGGSTARPEGIQAIRRPPRSSHLALPPLGLARIRKKMPGYGIYEWLVEGGGWGASRLREVGKE